MPMYATSIGLLMSAMKKQTSSIGEPELFGGLEPQTQTTEVSKPKESKRSWGRGSKKAKVKREEATGSLFDGVIDGVKNSIVSMFDEKDAEM